MPWTLTTRSHHMLGRRPDRLGSGWDMLDPICAICFPCYRTIKDRSKKHVHMFACSHETLCCHVSHCSATGGYPYRSQMLPIMCVCVNNNTKQHKRGHRTHAHTRGVCVCSPPTRPHTHTRAKHTHTQKQTNKQT